jgi:hypothetical protein
MQTLVIGHGGQMFDVRTCRSEDRTEENAVRLVDLAGLERLARSTQLRARCEHRNARPPSTGEHVNSRGRESTDLRRTHSHSRRNHDVARSYVASARPHVVSFANSSRNLDFVAVIDNTFDRNDGIGTVGNDTTGSDGHRLSRGKGTICRPTGRDSRDHGQAAGSIGSANGETVHRGAREGRQIHPRPSSFGGHASGSVRERDDLWLERRYPREDLRLRVLEREQVRHLVSRL